MWLFYSPFHTFIHKVLVTAHEAGQWDNLTFIATYPYKRPDGSDGGAAYSTEAINPYSKVPTLACDDGMVLYGSQTICEYLDSLAPGGRALYPEMGKARWDALRRLSLADLFFEQTVALNQEAWNGDAKRIELFEWLWPKMIRALDQMEKDVPGYSGFDIGHAAKLHALSYCDFSNLFYEEKDPVHPDYDFRVGRPNLAAWYEEAIKRPSVTSHFNKDFEGNHEPEPLQEAIKTIQALQAEHGTGAAKPSYD